MLLVLAWLGERVLKGWYQALVEGVAIILMIYALKRRTGVPGLVA